MSSISTLSNHQVDEALEQAEKQWKTVGQGHVFQFVSDLSADEKRQLLRDVQHLNPEQLLRDFHHVLEMERQLQSTSNENKAATDSPSPSLITPFTRVTDALTASASDRQHWYEYGLQLIGTGKVATVLMAGGQGTRLGSNAPKGCYDIGLPSHHSLFQIQAQRISRVKQLAAKHTNKEISAVSLRWYIMTSIVTDGPTRDYFAANEYFGLNKDDIFFFQQSELPAFTNDGAIILETKSKISLSPNGNGGIFDALQTSGALDDMENRGIEHVHVYGVDNVLVKVSDPTFIGFAALNNVTCANKVVMKTDPSEKVGVMCLRGGRPSVVEYSELSSEMSSARNSTGQLVYSAGNIAQHYFARSFLQQIGKQRLEYHIARKSIPLIDSSGSLVKPSKPNGIKLELFIFDIFERANDMIALAVERQAEFAAVKNANAPNAIDSPQTAKSAITAYHKQLLTAAGALVEGDGEIEICPLVTYQGEGLEAANGKTFHAPIFIQQLEASTLK